jgi:hypothetical protein
MAYPVLEGKVAIVTGTTLHVDGGFVDAPPLA